MSYILDALRRADAERGRGAVPGLHTQSMLPGARDDEPEGGLSPIAWMGIGAAIVVAAAVAWMWSGSADEPAQAVAAAPAAPAPELVAVAPAPAPAPLVLAPAPAPVIAPAPQKAASARQAAPAAAKASVAEERVYAINELPDAVRREIPPMTIGGSIYSEVPASRFLIINGRVTHEGDKVAPDLTLEQIKLKAAVLRFKGYRFGITY